MDTMFRINVHTWNDKFSHPNNKFACLKSETLAPNWSRIVSYENKITENTYIEVKRCLVEIIVLKKRYIQSSEPKQYKIAERNFF